MKVMFDLNIVLDVVQRREPHYRASAVALSKVVEGHAKGVFPCHGVTTVHYLLSRHSGSQRADEVVDWLASRFEFGTAARQELLRARSLPLNDFEDAVLSAVAEACGCDAIVTRNLGDFFASPVKAFSPEELVLALESDRRRE